MPRDEEIEQETFTELCPCGEEVPFLIERNYTTKRIECGWCGKLFSHMEKGKGDDTSRNL